MGKINWRGMTIWALTLLGILFLTSFTLVHWTERLILTTDNWVKVVTPLPKNEEVATALSQHAVDKLFEDVDLEQKISDALPRRAAFLAAPLTERVETRADQLAKNIIQSDQFQSVWATANRVAHERLVSAARDGGDQTQNNQKAGFALRLENLLQSIRERLGSSSGGLFSETKGQDRPISLNVDLKTKFNNFKKAVRLSDFLNSVLWLAALACLVWALALSRGRRRLFMAVMIILATIALLQLIGVKALRPSVLNQIQDISFRPAAGIIYDELLSSFQRSATVLFVISTLLFLIIFITGRPVVKNNPKLRKWLKDARGSNFWQLMLNSRLWVGRYRWPIAGIISFLILVYLAFAPELDWQSVINAGLVISIFAGLINLVSLSQPKRHIKTRRQ